MKPILKIIVSTAFCFIGPIAVAIGAKTDWNFATGATSNFKFAASDLMHFRGPDLQSQCPAICYDQMSEHPVFLASADYYRTRPASSSNKAGKQELRSPRLFVSHAETVVNRDVDLKKLLDLKTLKSLGLSEEIEVAKKSTDGVAVADLFHGADWAAHQKFYRMKLAFPSEWRIYVEIFNAVAGSLNINKQLKNSIEVLFHHQLEDPKQLVATVQARYRKKSATAFPVEKITLAEALADERSSDVSEIYHLEMVDFNQIGEAGSVWIAKIPEVGGKTRLVMWLAMALNEKYMGVEYEFFGISVGAESAIMGRMKNLGINTESGLGAGLPQFSREVLERIPRKL